MGSTEEDLRRDPRGPRRPGRGVSWRGRGGRSREARGLEEWREGAGRTAAAPARDWDWERRPERGREREMGRERERGWERGRQGEAERGAERGKVREREGGRGYADLSGSGPGQRLVQGEGAGVAVGERGEMREGERQSARVGARADGVRGASGAADAGGAGEVGATHNATHSVRARLLAPVARWPFCRPATLRDSHAKRSPHSCAQSPWLILRPLSLARFPLGWPSWALLKCVVCKSDP